MTPIPLNTNIFCIYAYLFSKESNTKLCLCRKCLKSVGISHSPSSNYIEFMFAMLLAINFDIVNMLVPEIINMNVVMFMGTSGCKILFFLLLSCSNILLFCVNIIGNF